MPRPTAVVPNDAVAANLQRETEEACAALIMAAEPDAIWTCSHCGGPMKSPERNWLNPHELRQQANPSGAYKTTTMGVALGQLIDEGYFRTSNDLQVKRTRKVW